MEATQNLPLVSGDGVVQSVVFTNEENGYTVSSDWQTNYNTTHDKDVKGDAYNPQTRVSLGGDWGSSSHCGSRAYNWNNGALELNDNIGFRAVADTE